jgi:uncharacterized protein (DUF2249 family)
MFWREDADDPATIVHPDRACESGSFDMTSANPQSGIDVIDVRSLVPAQRHATIFERVHNLAPEGRFVLVNDHDPKPLYYQLEAEYPQQFSWTYLERGPDVWRVEIGKLAQAA